MQLPFLHVNILFIFLSSLYTSITSLIPLDINTPIKHESFPEQTSITYSLATSPSSFAANFLSITTTPSSHDNSAHIYISFTSQTPTYQASTYKSYLFGRNTVYIPKRVLDEQSTFFIKVQCAKKPCDYTLSLLTTSHIELNATEQDISMYLNKNEEVNVTMNTNINNANCVVYITGSAMSDIELTNNKYNESGLTFEKVFSNGYAAIISKDDDVKANTTITIKAKEQTNIHIGKRNTFHNINTPTRITLMQNVKGSVINANNVQECFTLQHYSPNEGNVVMNIIAYMNGLGLSLTNTTTGNITRIEVVKNTNYFIFTPDEVSNTTLCIYPNKTTNIPSFGFEFQLYTPSNVSTLQNFLSPIIPGITSRHFLSRNSVAYHHLTPKYKITSRYELHLKTKEGNPVLYGMSCDNINYKCQIETTNELESLKRRSLLSTTHPINNHIHISLKPYTSDEPKEYVALIHCASKDEDCAYTLIMRTDQDVMALRNSHKVIMPVEKGMEDVFTFTVFPRNDLEKVEVILSSFSGKAEIVSERVSPSKLTPIPLYIGSKHINTYSKECFNNITQYNANEPSLSIDGEFKVKVTGISSAYYSIEYIVYDKITSNFYQISKGVTVTDYLTKQYNSKVFTFKNFHTDDNSPYIIIIKALNCKVDISFGDSTSDVYKSVIEKQILITNQTEFYHNYSYHMKIGISNAELFPNYMYCILKISNDEITQQQQMILNEGMSYAVILNTNNLNTYRLNYPYWFEGYGQSLLATLITYSSGEILYRYSIEGGKFSEEKALTSTKKLIITSYELDQMCFIGYLCSIVFKIRINPQLIRNNDTNAYFKIIISSTNHIPYYVSKDTLHINRVFEGKIQYYYTDVKLNETGKVYVHFLRGSGIAVAKVLSKLVNEDDADWNGRVKLPSINLDHTQRLPYDYYDNVLYYNTTHTSQCVNGCELFIAIYSTEVNSHLYSEFSLLFYEDKQQALKHSAIDITPNLYYFGNIYSLSDVEYYVYESKYPNEYLTVLFNCDNCVVNAVLMKGNKQLKEIQFNNTIGLVAKDFALDSFKQITFHFNIQIDVHSGSNTMLTDITNTKYYLQVVVPMKPSSTKKVVIKDWAYDEPCIRKHSNSNNDNDDDEFCYYVMTIFDYDYLRHIVLIGEVDDTVDKSSEIYVKFYSIEEFEEHINKETIESILPGKDMYDFMSSEGYLRINNSTNEGEFISENYLVIAFKPSKENVKTNLLINHYMTPENTNLLPNTHNVYFLDNNREVALNVFGNKTNKYLVELYVIEGEGHVYCESDPLHKTITVSDYYSIVVDCDVMRNCKETDLVNVPIDIIHVSTVSNEYFVFFAKYRLIGIANEHSVSMVRGSKVNKRDWTYHIGNFTFPIVYYYKGINNSKVRINYETVFSISEYVNHKVGYAFVNETTLSSIREGTYNVRDITVNTMNSIGAIGAFYQPINNANNDSNYYLIIVDSINDSKVKHSYGIKTVLSLYEVNTYQHIKEDQIMMNQLYKNDEDKYLLKTHNNKDEKVFYYELAFHTDYGINVTLIPDEYDGALEFKREKYGNLNFNCSKDIIIQYKQQFNGVYFIVISQIQSSTLIKVIISSYAVTPTNYMFYYHTNNTLPFLHLSQNSTYIIHTQTDFNKNILTFKPLTSPFKDTTISYLMSLYKSPSESRRTFTTASLLYNHTYKTYLTVNPSGETIKYNLGEIDTGTYALLLAVKYSTVDGHSNIVLYPPISIEINEYKSNIHWLIGIGVILGSGVVAFLIFAVYKKYQRKRKKHQSSNHNTSSEEDDEEMESNDLLSSDIGGGENVNNTNTISSLSNNPLNKTKYYKKKSHFHS